MGFSRQEYWDGLPFLSPRGLPDLLAYKLAKCFSSNGLNLSAPFYALLQARFQIFWEEVPGQCYKSSHPYFCSPWSYSSQCLGHRSPSFPLSIQSKEHLSGFFISIIFSSVFFHSDWLLPPCGRCPIFSASHF